MTHASAKRAIRAHLTRDRILDAAEEQFASRGFHGVSIRDITESAGVPLALANYHFGTKQQLFGQVIERRGKEHAAQMQKYLDEVLAAAPQDKADPERIVWAFCASVYERLIHGGRGWQRYIRLLAWSAEASQHEDFLEPLNRLFDPVLASYVRALRKSYPQMSTVDLYSAFYLLQASLVYTVAATGGIDRLSRGALRSTDFKRLLPRLVRFCAGGFERLARGED